MHQHYDAPLRDAANHVALSPLSFLKRAETVYATRPAVTYGDIRRTWGETGARCRSVAAGLAAMGVGKGDTICVLCPNIPELFELHYAVPLLGAVLNTVNVRLEPETVAHILDHSDSTLVIADTALAPLLRQAFRIMGRALAVVDIADVKDAEGFGQSTYDDLAAHPPMAWTLPEDEWQALALNYTSGTSGRPKGVIYHHRGAYLMAMGTVAGWALPPHPTYLSVVPMFHCNGWNHPWAMAIVGGHMIFTRDATPAKLLAAMALHRVTHLGAAPIVLRMLCDSPDAPAEPFDPKIRVLTAGAPPPPAILEKAAALGLDVMQVYGLTETYGHISQCLWQEDWEALTASSRAEKQAMQGVAFPMVEDIRVVDRATGADVARDGVTQGEIAIRANTVMKGYYKDAAATATAFASGWFWSGDAAVVHPDGYIQIRDRLKDVIISGGENISSVEVEAVLYRHPAILAAAVVARPHPKWGESPCAFVELREGVTATEAEVIAFCRDRIAHFKAPKTVVFGPLPKTATGKIQKFVLRAAARDMGPQA
ncbi:AMP-binding protein [Mesorhizobium sp. BH1-1-4]|uniref:AMP-binding protein n=1 Tax=Mesorhizobium sp. BH1-1-4 TaxID=2876662 RepID=UPI001CD140F7|nr:AMP-binding protein [Mesorhizobium sp. BH1-1-4]MBZ9996188.1 AMP-binding protein [Mesorhizobium sp. BH1-1-4]